MKKMIMMLGFLLNVIGSSLLANPGDEVTKLVKNTFNKKFPHAQYANWTEVADQEMYMVRFVNDEQALVAYISEDGELLATARTTLTTALPMPVSNLLKTEYGGYEVVDAVELVLQGELGYLITVQGHSKRLSLMVYGNGTAREIKKEKIK